MKHNLIFSFIIISIIKAQTSIISGFVSDSSSGEALIGANVFLQETGQGMATDINGYYIIQDIAPGNYTIMVSYIGFDMYKQNTRLKDDESKKVNINLVEQVVANRFKRGLFPGLSFEECIKNYSNSIDSGILKIMSKVNVA